MSSSGWLQMVAKAGVLAAAAARVSARSCSRKRMKSTKSSISAIRSAGSASIFSISVLVSAGMSVPSTRLRVAFYQRASPLPIPRPVLRHAGQGRRGPSLRQYAHRSLKAWRALSRQRSVSGFKNRRPRAGLVHQRGALAVGAGPERTGFYKNSGIGENIGPEVSQAMKLAPAIGQIFEEYRDIVIGCLVRIAARTGAEQHDALDPIAVEFINGGAEAAEDLVIGCGPGRSEGPPGSNPPEGSHLQPTPRQANNDAR